MKKSLLALAVMASFGLAGAASAAPALPGAAIAPSDVVPVRMDRMHGHHRQMGRRHRHGHMMRHHHHRRGHMMRHHHHRM